jgi:phage shock protein C
MTSTPHSDSPYTATPTAIPSAPRPELRRVRSGAMLGGVSGGLAAYTGIDTVLWRAAFLAGGAGLVLYAVLWVLTPPVPLGPGEQARPVDLAVERLAGRLSGDRAASPRD